ncbi:MAG: pilus assembly protein PilM [Clostridia bacterium]|jgi:hypothetical protein
MLRRNNKLYLFITDEMIYYVLRNRSYKILVCSEEPLPEGVLINGDVKKPFELYDILKNMISKNKMKVGEILFVIHEENILIRKITVNKEDITEKTVKDHIRKQIGNTIHFPFRRPVYDVHIQNETENSYEAVILLTDEDMLQDYLDIFQKLWISDVKFETSLLSFYRLYYNDRLNSKSGSKKVHMSEDPDLSVGDDLELGKRIAIIGGKVSPSDDDTDENLMSVALYNNNVSLMIFDGIYPVFSLIEDIDAKENYCEFVANYIERISNYYSFNMHKGRKEIEKIEIFNFTSGDVSEIIKEKMQVCVEKKKIVFFNFAETPFDYSEDIPRGCYIPLATGMER